MGKSIKFFDLMIFGLSRCPVPIMRVDAKPIKQKAALPPLAPYGAAGRARHQANLVQRIGAEALYEDN